MNIGTLTDKLHKLREIKRKHEAAIKDLSEEMAQLETQIIALLDAEGVTKATGKTATVSVSEIMRPSVVNWDEFYAYIHRHKYYHLLERRPSVSGCQELFELKGQIPGVVPFTQRRLNLRAL